MPHYIAMNRFVVPPENEEAFRQRWLEREVLFDTDVFPDGPHEPEVLYRIGPLTATG